MYLKLEQLQKHLQSPLRTVYVVSGDEPLQLGEATDAIRAAARKHGYTERVVLDAHTGFDWNTLSLYADSLSLFAHKRLIDLRLSSRKLGNMGAQALRQYAARPDENNVLLVTTGKVDADAKRSKWFKTLEAAGVVIQIWAIERDRLPAWVTRRAAAQGVNLAREAAVVLAERNEGNLLACAQEIDKLQLLFGTGTLPTERVMTAAGLSARYEAFDLVDAALQGDTMRAIRIVRGLREEGIDVLPVLGALAWALRSLAEMAQVFKRTSDLETALRGKTAWLRRKKAVSAALRRHAPAAWLKLLREAGEIDRLLKGRGSGDPWAATERLALGISGLLNTQKDTYNAIGLMHLDAS